MRDDQFIFVNSNEDFPDESELLSKVCHGQTIEATMQQANGNFNIVGCSVLRNLEYILTFTPSSCYDTHEKATTCHVPQLFIVDMNESVIAFWQDYLKPLFHRLNNISELQHEWDAINKKHSTSTLNHTEKLRYNALNNLNNYIIRDDINILMFLKRVVDETILLCDTWPSVHPDTSTFEFLERKCIGAPTIVYASNIVECNYVYADGDEDDDPDDQYYNNILYWIQRLRPLATIHLRTSDTKEHRIDLNTSGSLNADHTLIIPGDAPAKDVDVLLNSDSFLALNLNPDSTLEFPTIKSSAAASPGTVTVAKKIRP